MENVENNSNLTKEILKYNTIYNVEPSEVQFLPSVEESIKNIAVKQGFISHKISHTIIPSNGNYLGDLYEVDIKGETKDGPKEIHIFLKHVTPVAEALKSLVDVKTCYLHEVFFYTDLSTIFNMLQDNANVPEGERLKIVKSYECISDAIILENLAKKGFKTLNRMDVMPFKFAELSIAEIAKLNGLSFVLKHKMRDYFEDKIKVIETSITFDNFIWKNHANKMFEIMTTHLNSKTKEKIDYFRQNSFYEKFQKYLTGDTNSVKCIRHGDFRPSNVMYKEINGEVTEPVLIDYQFLCYGSPLSDIFYFIYLGTDRKFRKAHMNNLKDLYHYKLTEFLKYFDLDINEVYPKKVYEKDFKDSLEFGLMVALYVFPLIFVVDEDDPDFSKLDDRYKERIAEVVEEYTEWGILK